MKKIKLLMPILGITAIAPAAVSLASCGCKPGGGQDEPGKMTYEQFKTLATEIQTQFDNGSDCFDAKEVTCKEDGVEAKSLFVSQFKDSNNHRVVNLKVTDAATNGDTAISCNEAFDDIKNVHEDGSTTITSESYADCDTYVKANISFTATSGAEEWSFEIYKNGFLKKQYKKGGKHEEGSTEEYSYSVAPHKITTFNINWGSVDVEESYKVYLGSDTVTVNYDPSNGKVEHFIVHKNDDKATIYALDATSVTIKNTASGTDLDWKYNETNHIIEAKTTGLVTPGNGCTITFKLDASVQPGFYSLRAYN